MVDVLEDELKGKYYHPTERNIAEHLLIMVMVVFDREKKNPTEKIANTVNEILEKYYDKKIKFTKGTSIDTFKEHTYTLESMSPTVLLHKPKKA